MHNSAWVALLRHIPPEQHNQFMVMTASGVEIAVQGFLRIEAELVVLKGRLSGSQEQGRIFFIPFANIDYLGSAQLIKDAEFNAVFGSLTFPDHQAQPPAPADEAPADADPPAVNGNGHSSRTPAGGTPIIRSEVLERFRNSRSGNPSSSPNLPRPQP